MGARRAILRSSDPIPGPAASTFLARTSGLSKRERNAYINLINGLVFDGTWTLFDLLYILATNNTTTAALNLVSTSFSLVTNGSLTFNADVGYTGDGSTGYLDTQWAPSGNGVNFTLNSASIGAYIQSTTASVASVVMGSAITGTFSYMSPVNTGNVFTFNVNDNTFANFSNTNPQGAFVNTRTAITTLNIYKNGSATAVGTSAGGSTSLPTDNMILFGLNNNSAPGNFTNYQASAFFAGAGFTAAQAVTINNRINAYMTALGHNVY